jgi:hypothetical protein
MKRAIIYRLLAASAILLVLVAAANIASGELLFQPPPALTTPPPPPTPGPEPTLVPDTSVAHPVSNSVEAIKSVLAADKFWATREQLLTEEKIAATPDMVIVEQYATRGAAAEVYNGGHSPDPAVESEPVWVITIKGKVHVRAIGFIGAMRGGRIETDEVTYIISQKTGKLLEVITGPEIKVTK